MGKCNSMTLKGTPCPWNSISGKDYCKTHLKMAEKNKIKNLEVEKLELEIEELKKRWYRKATHQRALFPGVITLITSLIIVVATLWGTGYFDVEQKRLETKKTLLQIEIREFEKHKVSLNEIISDLESERDFLLEENSQKKTSEKKLKQAEEEVKNVTNQLLKLKESDSSKDELIKGYVEALTRHENLIELYKKQSKELKRIKPKVNNYDLPSGLKIDIDRVDSNFVFYLLNTHGEKKINPLKLKVLGNKSLTKGFEIPHGDLSEEFKVPLGQTFQLSLDFKGHTYYSMPFQIKDNEVLERHSVFLHKELP